MSADASRRRVGEVFTAFLKLGLTSFGGPIAHLGYFRNEFVESRKWLDEAAYADLVALCQFLPGPASSQVGFSLGILRGNGLLGGLAAWFAFTMPSALILFAFAMSAAAFTGPVAEGLLHGLKLVAVAVAAQAIWGMARTLTPDRARAAIALAAVAIVVFFAGSLAQITAVALGACAGLWLCRGEAAPISGHLNFPVTRLRGVIALSLFMALLLIPPAITPATGSQGLALFDAFYRSRALVLGGGHVVLPLLQAQVVAPRMGEQRDFSGRLRAGPSGAGAALHVRGLIRRVRYRPPRWTHARQQQHLNSITPSALASGARGRTHGRLASIVIVSRLPPSSAGPLRVVMTRMVFFWIRISPFQRSPRAIPPTFVRLIRS
jgi:chromate transport protein ChrA